LREGSWRSARPIDIGNGVVVTSSITNDAVDDLAIAPGDVIAVIKASDVMVAK
jgi:molybdopterin-binding protein